MQAEKIGRNELCPCGSNLKYKKCCLERAERVQDNFEEKIVEKAVKAQTQKIRKQYGSDLLLLDSNPNIVKMSEVILDISKEYLEKVHTDARRESVISLACIAWNLTFVEKDERETLINEMLPTLKIEGYESEFRKILKKFIKKKMKYYQSINRHILDYQIVSLKNHFHLNIVSAMPQEEFDKHNTETKSRPITQKFLERVRSMPFFHWLNR